MPLDCVTSHEVFIYDRGGRQRLWKLENLSRVKWSRVRDDISEAEVSVQANYCDAQADVLNSIQPNRHEIVIFRGDERVWEGPLNRPSYTSKGVSFFAKDVNWYLDATVLKAPYPSLISAGEAVTTRAKRIATAELNRYKETVANPPYNVLPYMVEHTDANTSKTLTSAEAFQYTLWEHIDKMAEDWGMDYTTIGRAIHYWDTHAPAMGQTATVTENDFIGDFTLSIYGMEMATAAFVTDGQGMVGQAGGQDAYFGEWDQLTTANDTNGDGVSDTTQSQQALNSAAVRALSGRNPTPMQVRLGDNSQVNPNGVLNITDLVPGIWIPLRSKLLTRNVAQVQKLDSVNVEENGEGGEVIQITMNPAPGQGVYAL